MSPSKCHVSSWVGFKSNPELSITQSSYDLRCSPRSFSAFFSTVLSFFVVLREFNVLMISFVRKKDVHVSFLAHISGGIWRSIEEIPWRFPGHWRFGSCRGTVVRWEWNEWSHLTCSKLTWSPRRSNFFESPCGLDSEFSLSPNL